LYVQTNITYRVFFPLGTDFFEFAKSPGAKILDLIGLMNGSTGDWN